MCQLVFKQYVVLGQDCMRGEKAREHHAQLVNRATHARHRDVIAVHARVRKVAVLMLVAIILPQLLFQALWKLRRLWAGNVS